MRLAALALALSIGCKSNDKPAPTAVDLKEQAVTAARKAADEATEAMHKAQAEAEAAWKRVEAAREEHAKASAEKDAATSKLAELRKEAAATIKLADAKLVELDAALAKVVDRIEVATKDVAASASDDVRGKAQAVLAKLLAQRGELEATIAKIKQMKSELEQTSDSP